MLTSMERDRHTSHLADFARPHATAIHHEFRPNSAVIGFNAGCLAAFFEDVGNLYPLQDCCPAIARPLGQSLRDIDGITLTIFGQPDTTNCIFNIQIRIKAADFSSINFINFDAKCAGHRRRTAQLFHPLITQGNCDRAISLETGGYTCLFFQREIEFLGIFCQPGHILGCPQLSNQASRMPGGP